MCSMIVSHYDSYIENIRATDKFLVSYTSEKRQFIHTLLTEQNIQQRRGTLLEPNPPGLLQSSRDPGKFFLTIITDKSYCLVVFMFLRVMLFYRDLAFIYLS